MLTEYKVTTIASIWGVDSTQRKLFIFLDHDDDDSDNTLDMTTRGHTADDMFRVTCSMLLAARHLLTFSRNLEVASSSSAESSAPAPPPPSSLWPVSGMVASLITLVPGAVFSVAALIITSSLSSLSSPPRHDLIIFIISSPYSAVRPLEFLWNKFWSRLSFVWNVSVSGYTAAAILTGLLLMKAVVHTVHRAAASAVQINIVQRCTTKEVVATQNNDKSKYIIKAWIPWVIWVFFQNNMSIVGRRRCDHIQFHKKYF